MYGTLNIAHAFSADSNQEYAVRNLSEPSLIMFYIEIIWQGGNKNILKRLDFASLFQINASKLLRIFCFIFSYCF